MTLNGPVAGNVDIAGNATTMAGPADPVFTVPQTGGVDAGTWTAPKSTGLLGQLGDWWDTSSVGDKLSAGGKLLSGVGTAGSAASAAKGPAAGDQAQRGAASPGFSHRRAHG